MKKLFVLSFSSILLLTGCGATETLSCSYSNTANNGSTNVTYDIDHEADEIKKVRITYNYDFNNDNNNTGNDNDGTNNTNDNNRITGDATDNGDNHMDGVGTGTDGTTNDTYRDDDGVVDGVVGSVIDTIVGSVTGIILDSAGLRDRHANVQNTYGNINGFSVQNTNNTDNNYKVTYVIDYDTISDTDLAKFNLSRNLNDIRNNYVNQGFTCK